MRYTVPDYYNHFKCTADRCEDTCCAGWQIMIDERTLKKYKKVKGPFGNRLFNSIDWKEGAFLQYNGRCAFLDENNLCDICSELGSEMFCKTCRNYPRHIEEFPGVREISLSLSCMEAAKLALGGKAPVTFLTKENEKEEREDENFDYLLYDKLLDVRECIFRILQNRNINIWTRVSMALALAHDAECKIRNQSLFQVDDVCTRYMREASAERFERKIACYRISEEERYTYMKEMFHIFDRLEVLKECWTEYVKGLKASLYQEGEAVYADARRRFRREVLEKKHFTEHLMVYFVFTYFCGGVYDGNAYAKMQAAVVSTLLIEELAQGLWKKQGERLSFMDFADVAHRFSREVEHSDDNLEMLEQIVSKEADFQLKNLLRLLG